MEGNNARQALQELLVTYTAMREDRRELDTALEAVMRRTRELRRQLGEADKTEVLDNLNETAINPELPGKQDEQDIVEIGHLSPLDLLIIAAQNGIKIVFPNSFVSYIFDIQVTQSRWITMPRCSRLTPSS